VHSRRPLPADRRCGLSSTYRRGPRAMHGHRQHAQKYVKIARVVPEISLRTDRQTHTQTDKRRQTYSSQYFATAPAGEVNIYLTWSRKTAHMYKAVYTVASRPKSCVISVTNDRPVVPLAVKRYAQAADGRVSALPVIRWYQRPRQMINSLWVTSRLRVVVTMALSRFVFKISTT